MPAERDRLLQARSRTSHWRRWGPYLSERSWGNPREDYSADGTAWDYFTHDHARSRAYRWTEDGIAGICDNHQGLCFAFAFLERRGSKLLHFRLYSGLQSGDSPRLDFHQVLLDRRRAHGAAPGLRRPAVEQADGRRASGTYGSGSINPLKSARFVNNCCLGQDLI